MTNSEERKRLVEEGAKLHLYLTGYEWDSVQTLIEQQIADYDKQVAEPLASMLEKRGMHSPSCWDGMNSNNDCTCGIDAALATYREAKEGCNE